jgi:cysteine desulfurase
VVFTSGATEANHALFAWMAEKGAQRVAVSAVEHPSVREPAMRYFGERCVEIPVDENGVVSAEVSEADLVSVMAACNETGVIQPWRDFADSGAVFHTDATQWVGKLPLDGLCECDFVTGSAHKFGGPKGVGFLIVDSEESKFRAQCGGPQERGMRAGTENYPAVAAMLAALEDVVEKAGDSTLRDDFEAKIVARIPGVRVIGAGAERLWNTSMLIMPEHEHVKWLTRLDRAGFQVSTGSACSTGSDGPSHVLQAMGGYDFATMKRALRVSSGWETTAAEWDDLLEALAGVSAGLAEK